MNQLRSMFTAEEITNGTNNSVLVQALARQVIKSMADVSADMTSDEPQIGFPSEENVAEKACAWLEDHFKELLEETQKEIRRTNFRLDFDVTARVDFLK